MNTEVAQCFFSQANRHKSVGMRIVISLFFVLLSVSCQTNSAWLSMCNDLPLSALNNRGEGYLSHVLSVEEKVSILKLVTAQPDNLGCEAIELAVDAEQVVWGGFVDSATGKAKQIALQGRELNGRFTVSEIISNDTSEAAPIMPKNKPRLATGVPHSSSLRASWFWSPASWMVAPKQIFDAQNNLALTRIYITVPVSNRQVQNHQQLRQFLQAAHEHGLQVWVVIGDPYAVLDNGKEHFLELVEAYQGFNTANSQQQLDGLQLDIEPYLLPGYQLNPAIWLQKQAKIVNVIHQIAPKMSLDLVLPFWFEPAHGDSADLLANVEASIVSITVMNYRTNSEQIIEFAEKFLAWGELRKKAVFIALESLGLPEEDRRVYRQAESGELWHFSFKTAPVLLLLQQQTQDLPGGKAYRFLYSRKIDGSSTSFFRQPGELTRLLPSLESHFSAWSSFAGIALHGQERP